MTPNTSRRQFFKSTGAVSAAAMLGGAGLTACGGSSSGVAALSVVEELAPLEPTLEATGTKVVGKVDQGLVGADDPHVLGLGRGLSCLHNL